MKMTTSVGWSAGANAGRSCEGTRARSLRRVKDNASRLDGFLRVAMCLAALVSFAHAGERVDILVQGAEKL